MNKTDKVSALMELYFLVEPRPGLGAFVLSQYLILFFFQIQNEVDKVSLHDSTFSIRGLYSHIISKRCITAKCIVLSLIHYQNLSYESS